MKVGTTLDDKGNIVDVYECEKCGIRTKSPHEHSCIITKREPPKELTPQNIMYWCPESQELLKKKKDGDKQSATLLTKAQDFLDYECIEKTGEDEYICKPIEGYNKHTYKLKLTPSGDFFCTCQGFTHKLKNDGKGYCSHCLAVQMYRYLELKGGKLK